MPRVTHKGAISFGLVHIPVGLYKATQDADIHFNQLCKEDHSRIQYKKICSSCGKEVKNEDIVKGFKYSDSEDAYVILSDEDFEMAKSEKDRGINIIHFAPLDSIPPIYFDQSYHIVPENGGDKAFALLRQAMLEENKVAIAKTVMGNAGKLLAILPVVDGMIIETLYFEEEIREMPKPMPVTQINEEEIKIAKQLVGAMEQEFKPELYTNEYQEKLREIIESKIEGKEIVSSGSASSPTIINIMEALQTSLKERENQSKKPKRKQSSSKAKGA